MPGIFWLQEKNSDVCSSIIPTAGENLTLNVYLSASHPQIMPETEFKAEAAEPTTEKKRSSAMNVCPYACKVKIRLT